MLSLQNVLLLLAVLCGGLALQCYTGFKYLNGQSVGTDKVTCSEKSDYCYNMTADLTQLNKLSKAGCSTTRCLLNRNKCFQTSLLGKTFQFCCCNTGDLCNSKFTNLSTFDKAKERVRDIFNIFG
ncbi:unnamed protein product [Nippostrongylus brasiliensis]|uniref:Activin_recp domain-containing protein n=1 Tax=Nippostrongylus brasiliensis TaxID=27835 RepID=A0A0N4Y8Q3_NIPBR|nr:unnamed protein product [Nippostrongylus brasiliensis]